MQDKINLLINRTITNIKTIINISSNIYYYSTYSGFIENLQKLASDVTKNSKKKNVQGKDIVRISAPRF